VNEDMAACAGATSSIVGEDAVVMMLTDMYEDSLLYLAAGMIANCLESAGHFSQACKQLLQLLQPLLSASRKSSFESLCVQAGLSVIPVHVQLNPSEVHRCNTVLRFGITVVELDISGCHLGLEGSKTIAWTLLASSSSLTKLNVADNQLGLHGGEAVGDALRFNTSLASLNVSSNRLGAMGVKAIGEALSLNTSLTSLDLSFNFIDDAGVQVLAKSLVINSSLEELKLHSNGIGPEGCNAVAEALMVNKSLTCLDCAHNYFGAEGGMILGKVLRRNRSLKQISLWGNALGQEGGKAIGEAMHANLSIESLDTRRNEIVGEAAEQLARAVILNKAITSFGGIPVKEMRDEELNELNLSDVSLGQTECGVLAGLVLVCNSLTSLDVSMNKFGPDGIKLLIPGVAGSISLKSFELRGNRIGSEGAKAMGEALVKQASLIQNRSSLTSMDLRHNLLGSVEKAAILAVVKDRRNFHLQI